MKSNSKSRVVLGGLRKAGLCFAHMTPRRITHSAHMRYCRFANANLINLVGHVSLFSRQREEGQTRDRRGRTWELSKREEDADRG